MDIKGTNELISGEKPSIAILSNLRCLFTRLISITTTYNFNSDISDLVVISSLGVLSVMVRVKCHV